MMLQWAYVGSVLVVALGLPIFSYLALIYRELGRMATGRVHKHVEIFEAEIEPKLKIGRRSGGRTSASSAISGLRFVASNNPRRGLPGAKPLGSRSTIPGLSVAPGNPVDALHPVTLLYRTTGRWLLPLLPLIRVAIWLASPVRMFLEGAESLARISEQEVERTDEQRTEEGIEALVEVAEEEGIVEPDRPK